MENIGGTPHSVIAAELLPLAGLQSHPVLPCRAVFGLKAEGLKIRLSGFRR